MASHQFAETTIGGHAIVQQGDRHTTNVYHIGHACLVFGIDSRAPSLREISRASGTHPEHPTGTRYAYDPVRKWHIKHTIDALSGQCAAGNDDQGRCSEGRAHEGDIPRVDGQKSTPEPASDNKRRDLETLIGAVQGTKASRVDRDLLSVLLAFFPKALTFLTHPNDNSDDGKLDDGMVRLGVTAASLQNGGSSIQDLVAFFLAFLSYSLCESTSPENGHPTKHQGERALPALAAALAFGLARYLVLPQFTQRLSGWSGDCIVLEDASGATRRVPLSHCGHFTLLKAFLEVYYEGRPGQKLVQEGQFNPTLGSRRGPAIRETDWISGSGIKQGCRVVLSVYLRSQDAKCAICQSRMTVSKLGEFFCSTCGRYYRDCDTLGLATKTSTARAAQTRLCQTSRQDQEDMKSEFVTSCVKAKTNDEAALQEIANLVNIDILIVHRSSSSRAGNAGRRRWAEDEEARDLAQGRSMYYDTPYNVTEPMPSRPTTMMKPNGRPTIPKREQRQAPKSRITPAQPRINTTNPESQTHKWSLEGHRHETHNGPPPLPPPELHIQILTPFFTEHEKTWNLREILNVAATTTYFKDLVLDMIDQRIRAIERRKKTLAGKQNYKKRSRLCRHIAYCKEIRGVVEDGRALTVERKLGMFGRYTTDYQMLVGRYGDGNCIGEPDDREGRKLVRETSGSRSISSWEEWILMLSRL
ncbi:hypothetical protein OHC33_010146 [Knufia fluminis]|uniref:Ubiquitin-like domain-containing protein n=1 Tax=Knufia fluminis TaxID=191047 RepID=A0AAN8EA06_9EURO|nr:hypothetical protein OHC33_010146 [Knufia fluminis]